MAFSLSVCPDQDDSDTYLTLEALHIQLGVREKHMGKKKAFAQRSHRCFSSNSFPPSQKQ